MSDLEALKQVTQKSDLRELPAQAPGLQAEHQAVLDRDKGEFKAADLQQVNERFQRAPTVDTGLSGSLSGRPERALVQSSGLPAHSEKASQAETAAAVLSEAEKAGTLIGEQKNGKQPFEGAKQYRLITGEEIWQLPDGRILRQSKLQEGAAAVIWAPRGSGQQSGILFEKHEAIQVPASDTGATVKEGSETKVPSYLQGTRVDHHGGYVESGSASLLTERLLQPDQKFVLRREALGAEQIDLLNSLDLIPGKVEAPSTARKRLLTIDGQEFERVELPVYANRVNADGSPYIADTSTSRFFDHHHYDLQASVKQPFRVYRILSEAQMIQAADLQEQLKENRISKQDYEAGLKELQQKAVPVAYPEDIAVALEKQRDLRELAALNPQIVESSNGPAATARLQERIMAARRELLSQTYADMLLPEEWGRLLDTLPDRSHIKVLKVLPWNKPGIQQAYMEANMLAGELTQYASLNALHGPTQLILSHEWAHLAEPKNLELVNAFRAFSTLEWDGLRDYANLNGFERWAVNVGEGILSANAETAIAFAYRNPLQTLLASMVLRAELENVAGDKKSIYADELKYRIDVLEQMAAPKAREVLLEKAKVGNAAYFASYYAALDALLKAPGGIEKARSLLSKEDLSETLKKMVAEEWTWSGREHQIRVYSFMDLCSRIHPELVDQQFLRQRQELEARLVASLHSVPESALRNHLELLPLMRGAQLSLYDGFIDTAKLESLLSEVKDLRDANSLLHDLVAIEFRRNNQKAVRDLVFKYFDPGQVAWETAAREGFASSDEAQLLKLTDKIRSHDGFKSVIGASETLARILHQSNYADLAALADQGLERYTTLRPLIRLEAVDYMIRQGFLNEFPELIEANNRRLALVVDQYKQWLKTELESAEPARRQNVLVSIEGILDAKGPSLEDLANKLDLEKVLLEASSRGHQESELARQMLGRLKGPAAFNVSANGEAELTGSPKLRTAGSVLRFSQAQALKADNEFGIEMTRNVTVQKAGAPWRLLEFRSSTEFPALLLRESSAGSVEIFGRQLEEAAAHEARKRPVVFRIGDSEFHVKAGSSEAEIKKAVSDFYDPQKEFYRSPEGQLRRFELKEFMVKNDVQNKVNRLVDSLPVKLAEFQANKLVLPELLGQIRELASLDASFAAFNLLENFGEETKARIGAMLIEAGFLNQAQQTYEQARALSGEAEARWIIAEAAREFAAGRSSALTESYADSFARLLNSKERFYLRAGAVSDQTLLNELRGGVNEELRLLALREVVTDGYKAMASDWTPELAQKYIIESREALNYLIKQAGLDSERMQAIERALARLDKLSLELSGNSANGALEELQRLVDSGLRLRERDLQEKDRIQKELVERRFRQRLVFGIGLGGTVVGAAVIGLLFVENEKDEDKTGYKRSKIGR